MDKLKKKFFQTHLALSLILVSIITLLCKLYWFPSPFLLLDGTWIALLILATIDIVIGPLITLIIVSSKKNKRELTFDLIIVLIIQLSFLGYGLINIEKERIVSIVHYDGVFHLVPKKVLSDNSPIAELPEYHGVKYAMIDSTLMTSYSDVPFLYDLNYYTPITLQEISKDVFAYNNLPEYIQEQYKQDYTFKLLVGKKRTAIIIFDNDANIENILLIPKAD